VGARLNKDKNKSIQQLKRGGSKLQNYRLLNNYGWQTTHVTTEMSSKKRPVLNSRQGRKTVNGSGKNMRKLCVKKDNMQQ
jgi:hypothetical protein